MYMNSPVRYLHTAESKQLVSVSVLCLQRRLGDAAKKAISKLQVRTIKKGDKVNGVPHVPLQTALFT